jgi:hypothetical protein
LIVVLYFLNKPRFFRTAPHNSARTRKDVCDEITMGSSELCRLFNQKMRHYSNNTSSFFASAVHGR